MSHVTPSEDYKLNLGFTLNAYVHFFFADLALHPSATKVVRVSGSES